MRGILAALVVALTFVGEARADDWALCDKVENPDPAIAACTRIIGSKRVSRDDLAAAYNDRGLAFHGKHDEDRAIADYDQAVRLKPSYAEAYSNRGDSYEAKGDHDRAIADYDKAVAIDPKLSDAYFGRAYSYYGKNDYDRAIADDSKAIAIDPKFSDAYNDRGLAYDGKGDHDRAIADFDQAIRLSPRNAVSYANRGYAYYGKNDYDRAIADLDKAIDLDPKYGTAYEDRGLAYDAKGDTDQAMADYDKAIDIDPKSAVAYDDRGFSYEQKGDHDHAIADYDRAIGLDSSLTIAFEDRGASYQAKGDYERAIADESAAIKLKPDDGNAYYTRGNAYAAQGTIPEAIADYRTAAQMLPESNVLHGQALTRVAELEKRIAKVDAAPPPAKKEAPATPEAPGRRLALVIGNAAYGSAGKLANPEHDADAITQALKSDGFEVTETLNVSRADFIAALDKFADLAASADWATIYFAGHGLQIGGVNYLIPVDARLTADRDVPDEAIALDRLLEAVGGAKKFGLVVVDACRNNPFVAAMKATTRASRTRGLARVEPEGTTLVEFSARDGQEALDGDASGNSPFAAALAKLLATPGLEVGKLMREVRAEVLAATAKQQEPMFTGNIPPEDLFFRSAE
jgi:tetratricopeptide (TPR) repeat protein